MNQSRPLVYIVDDDPIIAPNFIDFLSEMDVQTRSFSNGPEFLHTIQPAEIACVLLDMRMPEMSGLEVQAKLRDQGCLQPVVFTTSIDDVGSAVSAMRHGALDYLLKPVEKSELITRVEAALTEAQITIEENQEATIVRGRYDRLTPREREVLALMVEGKANKVMSVDLGVSQRTVEIHRARVMEKMEAKSLAELFRLSLYLELG
ncbi:MAG: response regulator transcription factor [Litorivicinus sp.]